MTLSNDQLASTMQQVGNLYLLQSILVNMQTNLTLISEGGAGTIINVSNVSLYQIAAQYYGDATLWTVIAEANGLTDPFVTGGQIVQVVVTNGGTGYFTPMISFNGNQIIEGNAEAFTDNNGVITGINVITPGLYVGQPEITITDASGSGSGATATAVCVQQLVIPPANNLISNGGILTDAIS